MSINRGAHRLIGLKLKELKAISPSRYFNFISCPLREVLEADDDTFHLLPTSPTTWIGIIIHNLFEKASTGIIKEATQLEEQWEYEVSRIEDKMKESWIELHLVPLSKHGWNYEVKKYKSFHMLKNIIECRKYKYISNAKSGKTVDKLKVMSNNRRIIGRLDEIRNSEEGIQIIDYKTGVVFDVEDNQFKIKQQYKEQLKLYAALYHDTHKVWPKRLTIINLNREEYEIEFSVEECKLLLEEATDALRMINNKISKGCSYEEIANPSLEECKYCGYRPICNAYWLQRNDTDKWPNDYSDTIMSKTKLGNNSYRVTLKSEDKIINIRGLLPKRHRFLEDEVNKVMFCNLEYDGNHLFFKQGLYTTSYIVDK